MKRKVSFILMVCLILASVFGASEESAALNALTSSALRSPSYSGSIEDVFVNPATLPLLRDQKLFKVSVATSESYNTSLFGSTPSPFLQNLNTEIQGTVTSGSLAVSAKFSNRLRDKRITEDGRGIFAVYTGVDIELDLGYRIGNNFSFGFRLGGGNSLSRQGKEIKGPVGVIENALFSPYEKVSGSERFSSTVGILIFNDNLSFGMTTKSIIGEGLSMDGFFRRLMGNTTLALSFIGDRYSAEGDLNLIVPRIGGSLTGMGIGEERSLTIGGDISLQFLKNAYLDVGMKYLYLAGSDGISNILSFSMLGVMDDFSLGLNISVDFLGEYDLLPSLVFTYSNGFLFCFNSRLDYGKNSLSWYSSYIRKHLCPLQSVTEKEIWYIRRAPSKWPCSTLQREVS